MRAGGFVHVMHKRHKLLRYLLILAATAAILLFSDVWCMSKLMTGFPCPGCGMTRACLSFLHGDMEAAFYYHPLFWLIIPLLLLVLIRGERLTSSSRLNKAIGISLLILVVGTYVVRMILLFPHTPPMDYYKGSLLYRLYTLLFH